MKKMMNRTHRHVGTSVILRPPLFVGFPEGYDILYAPRPIRYASGHSRGRAKCTMNLDEIVGEIK
jgi:hypothetical protein